MYDNCCGKQALNEPKTKVLRGAVEEERLRIIEQYEKEGVTLPLTELETVYNKKEPVADTTMPSTEVPTKKGGLLKSLSKKVLKNGNRVHVEEVDLEKQNNKSRVALGSSKKKGVAVLQTDDALEVSRLTVVYPEGKNRRTRLMLLCCCLLQLVLAGLIIGFVVNRNDEVTSSDTPFADFFNDIENSGSESDGSTQGEDMDGTTDGSGAVSDGEGETGNEIEPTLGDAVNETPIESPEEEEEKEGDDIFVDCENEIKIGPGCYPRKQPIGVMFHNCEPLPTDIFAVYSVNGNETVVVDTQEEDPLKWFYTCGNQYCNFAVIRSIFQMPPVLDVGTYQMVLMRNLTAQAYVASPTFEVRETAEDCFKVY